MENKDLRVAAESILPIINQNLSILIGKPFRDLELLSRILKNKELQNLKLHLENIPLQNDDFCQKMRKILTSKTLRSLDLSIDLNSSLEELRIINKFFPLISPSVENLLISVNLSRISIENMNFMGENLNYLKNIKNFKLKIMNLENDLENLHQTNLKSIGIEIKEDKKGSRLHRLFENCPINDKIQNLRLFFHIMMNIVMIF